MPYTFNYPKDYRMSHRSALKKEINTTASPWTKTALTGTVKIQSETFSMKNKSRSILTSCQECPQTLSRTQLYFDLTVIRSAAQRRQKEFY